MSRRFKNHTNYLESWKECQNFRGEFERFQNLKIKIVRVFKELPNIQTHPIPHKNKEKIIARALIKFYENYAEIFSF